MCGRFVFFQRLNLEFLFHRFEFGDDFVEMRDGLEERFVGRDVDAGDLGKADDIIGAACAEKVEPAFDGGFALPQNIFTGDGGDGESRTVRVGIESHIIVGLAHPGEFGTFVNRDGIAPEFLERCAFELGEFRRVEDFARVDELVDFALIVRLE